MVEGKYFFTIVDFVNAYHLFNDPQWDGAPVDIINKSSAKGSQNSAQAQADQHKKIDDNTQQTSPKKPRIKFK